MPNESQMLYPASTVFAIVLFTSIVTVHSLRHASSRYMEPIYGNVFPYHYLNEATALVFILALTVVCGGKVVQRRNINSHKALDKTLNAASLLLALSPLSMNTLFAFSSQWGPLWGPHLTQISVLYGTTFLLGISCAISGMQWLISQRKQLNFIPPMVSLFFSYLTCTTLQVHLFSRPSCQAILLNSATLGVSGALLSIVILRRKVADAATICRNLIPQAIVAMTIIYIFTRSPHCGYNLEREQIVPNTKWVILDKVESVTGWVEVVEETGRMNMRVMRSGHSLLGGRFRDTGESIFQTFHLLEAVSVFDRPILDDKSIRALQIGLGCGIATNALLSQGIDVDVVELDPAVYHMARDYFDLIPPTSVHLESGRPFLERCNSSLYDFILHDIFTGGSVAPGMFSKEVLDLVKHCLKDNGILAMVSVSEWVSLSRYRDLTLLLVSKTELCRLGTARSSSRFGYDRYNSECRISTCHMLP
ncbi:S-adenosyl-L-methionine-dependent methyltransferase [Umbelopsis sp. AD052]|nr:S-adenosyl-L-methionine-dependent methyltransferase [Umbelopsis sp. AD052]